MNNIMSYRLALVLPRSRELAVLFINGVYKLPRFPIRVCERVAPQLSVLVKKEWKVQSIVLDVIADDSPESPCAVIEVREPDWKPSNVGLSVVDLEQVEDEVNRPSECSILHSILTGSDGRRGPFARIGWIEDVHAWVRQFTARGDDLISGNTIQLNAGGRYCLVRLVTVSGKAYWVKATGFPNTREFAITTFLSVTCPQHLPRLVASRQEWNAWIMEEHGTSLAEGAPIAVLKDAARKMADLQKSLIGKSDRLLAVGCGDHRIDQLDSSIAGLMSYLDDAMSLQLSTKAPRLSSERLRALEAALHRACLLHHDLSIPDTLIHCDMNPGSILYDGVGCVFTDWCEANLGNPFITAEQMWRHAAHSAHEPAICVQEMKEEYKSCWTDVLTEHQLELSFQLAPLLAAISHMQEICKWFTSSTQYDPQRLSYARSLGRYIDRLIQAPLLQESLCC